MHTLSRLGIEVDLPDGWDGRIYDRPDEGRPALRRGLHAANFPLPTNLADFGTGAIRTMRGDDVLMVMLEYPGEAGAPLFSRQGVPLPLTADAFSPNAMPQAVPGRSGAQFFFSEAGRAFSLFMVVGSHPRRGGLVPLLGSVLETIRIGG